MCLDTLIKNRRILKISTRGYFYVWVRKYWNEQFGLLRGGVQVYQIERWYDAKKYVDKHCKGIVDGRNRIYTKDMRYRYCPYFHVFMTVEDAARYRMAMEQNSVWISSIPIVLVSCKIDTVVAVGLQKNIFVVVTRFRKITKEV